MLGDAPPRPAPVRPAREVVAPRARQYSCSVLSELYTEVTRHMAAVCEVCGKHPSWGMSVSHSHRRTKRRWNPNIQRVRAVVDGAPKRVQACTGCIKSGKVQKLVH